MYPRPGQLWPVSILAVLIFAGGCRESGPDPDAAAWRSFVAELSERDRIGRLDVPGSTLVSSYDRTGENNDFNGYVRKGPEGWWVIADLKGPGYVSRFWSTGVPGDGSHRLKFFFDGEKAVSEIVALPRFEGYKGVYHGGILATMLDEIMIKAILAQERYVVTADMSVRFLRPVITGDRVRFTGWVVRSKGRVFFAEGKATTEDGQKIATSSGRYVEAKGNLRDILVQSSE